VLFYFFKQPLTPTHKTRVSGLQKTGGEIQAIGTDCFTSLFLPTPKVFVISKLDRFEPRHRH
jgi:hypothetical protein